MSTAVFQAAFVCRPHIFLFLPSETPIRYTLDQAKRPCA